MSETMTAPPAHGVEDHRPLYLKIFGALMVCTVLTVGVAFVELPPSIGIPVAFAIAACKAMLVLMYFMHVKFEVKAIYVILGVPLLLSAILVVALWPDGGFSSTNHAAEKSLVK